MDAVIYFFLLFLAVTLMTHVVIALGEGVGEVKSDGSNMWVLVVLTILSLVFGLVVVFDAQWPFDLWHMTTRWTLLVSPIILAGVHTGAVICGLIAGIASVVWLNPRFH